MSDTAIEHAVKSNRKGTFVVADLATWDTAARFDVVAVLYVFVHFVDDEAWRSILHKAMSWVDSEGALLFADEFPTEREARSPHVVGRPLDEYLEAFGQQGFIMDPDFKAALMESAGRTAGKFYLARRT